MEERMFESVVENGVPRRLTECERLIADWCAYHADLNNTGVRWICYANFEGEPYEANWFSDAIPAIQKELERTGGPFGKRTKRMIELLGWQPSDFTSTKGQKKNGKR